MLCSKAAFTKLRPSLSLVLAARSSSEPPNSLLKSSSGVAPIPTDAAPLLPAPSAELLPPPLLVSPSLPLFAAPLFDAPPPAVPAAPFVSGPFPPAAPFPPLGPPFVELAPNVRLDFCGGGRAEAPPPIGGGGRAEAPPPSLAGA